MNTVDKLLNRDYDIAIANHPFLWSETQACARLLVQFKSWDQLPENAEETIFSSGSPSTQRTYLRAIRYRLEGVPAPVLECLAADEAKLSGLALFYILLYKNRLLRELMEEPIRDHFLSDSFQIEKSELEDFFEHKRQRHSDLLSWSDSTWRKFWQNTLKSVFESGLLTNGNPLTLEPGSVPEPLAAYLLSHSDQVSLQLMLDPRY